MKTKKITVAVAIFLSLAVSSFVIHKSNHSTRNQKPFTTYLCNHQYVQSDLDAGGTELLRYVNFSLVAANNNIGTIATINYADIESSTCVTYTINSFSGDFIRIHTNFSGDHWKARDVTVHYTGPNGDGTLHLVDFGFVDGGYAC